MLKPDALSRRLDYKQVIENDNKNVTLISPEHISMLYIHSMITVTTEGDKIVELIKSKGEIEINKNDKNTIWEKDGRLIFRNSLIVVKDDEIKRKIFELYHDSTIAGHLGRNKTKKLILKNYWWSKLTDYVNKYVDSCRKCQQTKIFPQKPRGFLSLNTIPEYPFQIISTDFITGLPT